MFTRDAKIEALKRAPLFEQLSRKQLALLARLAEDLEVEAGTVLCREGQRGHEFFVIMEGEAEVTKDGEHVATCRSGDFFGEISLIENVPRVATVKAATRVRSFVLTRQSFLPLLDDEPSIERKVLRALAKRMTALSTDPTV